MRRMMRFALALAAVLAAVDAGAATPVDALRTLPVQDGGRVKPLDTFAREAARRVTGARAFGAESVGGLEPVEWVVAMMARPEQWKDAQIVRVSHAGLRSAVGLPGTRDRYSFRELASHKPLLEAADAVRTKEEAGGDVRLDPVEREVADLYGTLALMSEIFSGEALHVRPDPSDAHAAWGTWAGLAEGDGAQARRAGLLASAVLSAYSAGDVAETARAASALRARLGTLASGAAREADMEREVRYNQLKPFRFAWSSSFLGLPSYCASRRIGVSLASQSCVS